MNGVKTERKLDYFSATIQQCIDNAKIKSRAETNMALNIREKEILESAARQAKMSFDATKQELSRTATKQISQAKVECITRYVTLKKQQTDELFTLAKAHLASFTLSAGYKNYLFLQINAAYSPLFHLIKLSPQDMRFENEIADRVAIAVQEGEHDMIGGFILLDKNSTIMADYSFETRLTAVMKNFRYEDY